MGVGLVTISKRIEDFVKKCSFNPFKNPNPVYWPDLVELSSIVRNLHHDIENINSNLPPFWSAASTGTPNNWFSEVYPASNVRGVLTTLYQDVLQANSTLSSGSSIDYHYRVNIGIADGSSIYVKAQQDYTLTLNLIGMKIGDTVIGSSSGAVGNIIAVSNYSVMLSVTSGNFTISDTITGSISGVVANVLIVYPLKVWLLGELSPTVNNKSYYIDGKIILTNAIAGSGFGEFFVTYNTQTTFIANPSSMSGINPTLPIKLLLQGESSIANNITAVYGRGVIYQLIPQQ